VLCGTPDKEVTSVLQELQRAGKLIGASRLATAATLHAASVDAQMQEDVSTLKAAAEGGRTAFGGLHCPFIWLSGGFGSCRAGVAAIGSR
jgi:hypothetical protein